MASWDTNNGATKPGTLDPGSDGAGRDPITIASLLLIARGKKQIFISDRNNIKNRDPGSNSAKC